SRSITSRFVTQENPTRYKPNTQPSPTCFWPVLPFANSTLMSRNPLHPLNSRANPFGVVIRGHPFGVVSRGNRQKDVPTAFIAPLYLHTGASLKFRSVRPAAMGEGKHQNDAAPTTIAASVSEITA